MGKGSHKGKGKDKGKGALPSSHVLEAWVPWLGRDFDPDHDMRPWFQLVEEAGNEGVHIKLSTRNSGRKLVIVAQRGPLQLVRWAERIIGMGRRSGIDMLSLGCIFRCVYNVFESFRKFQI